jgi:hypothetical protein
VAPQQRRRPTVNLIDETSIDEEVKAQLRAKARSAVAAEQKEATEEALYAQFLEEERRALDPKHEIKYLVLDMAGHSDRIMLDGVVYFHGIRYGVAKPVYEMLREIVQRGWAHEDEIGGANRAQYQKPRDTQLSRGGLVTHRGLVGAR